MAADALKLLEFPELLALVGRYVGSPLGQQRLEELVPGQSREAVSRRLALASEAREYLRSQQSGGDLSKNPTSPAVPVSFTGFGDPSELISKVAAEGVTLELEEISALLHFAEGALEVRRAVLAMRRHFPQLAAIAERLGDFQELLKQWRGKILPNGELDDRASPGLARIRREIERQRGVILSSLRNLMRGLAEETSSQDEIVTVRGDRFVVPVRVAKRGQVKGVVHGSSSSGQTVYMEPLETIELNNDLVRLRDEELAEIHRILTAMTAALRERAADLSASAEAIGVLDLAFACGRFAKEYDCVIPQFNSDAGTPLLRLQDARHPLLESFFRKKGMKVVPVSLELDSEHQVLVISGPNTGGKTVALKTVGLLAMMASAGLPVPAAEAEFPWFDRILADIGDSQSIQESLSTFSAHLVNIASMIAEASPDSLILLDELGSATDPEEAGALAVAVVERFHTIGGFTLASTHHMAVKAYAAAAPGILSANMGFDQDTLAPTYLLEVGRPGSSSGIAIAERLGLPHEVVARAKQSLSAAHVEVEKFLSRLKADTDAATELRANLETKLAALDQREREWTESQHRRELERAREWEKQLEGLLESLEERAEQKLRDISAQAARPMRPQEQAKKAAQVTSKLRQNAQEELRQTLVAHLGAFPGESVDPSAAIGGAVSAALNVAVHLPVSPHQAGVGDTVKLKSLGRNGVVRGRSENGLEVEVGMLRMRVSFDDIAEVIPALPPSLRMNAAAPKSSHVSVQMEGAAKGSVSEINVIGENADDARRRVDKFLDNAYLASLTRVRVVHGSGKGILRKSLAEMFAEHPHVEKFSPAPQEEGGAGATIVELKT